MSLMARKCAVCKKPTTLFNYGVSSCNACKLFFRRVIIGGYPERCTDNGRCALNANVTSMCRFCRFQVCVQAGMMYKPPRKLIDTQRMNSISVLLNHVKYLDCQRKFRLVNCFMEGDPTMSELAETGHLKFVQRPEKFPMTLVEWGFISMVTSIDYMKKFHFTSLLEPEDRKLFVSNAYFPFSILSSAMRAYQAKREKITFPDGSDVIPGDMYPISRVLENRIRCRLVGRLVELKLTNQEFLLLSVVFLCNPSTVIGQSSLTFDLPGIPSLSENGRAVLASSQRMYSSTLFQYCLINYQQSGPSRFTDLLSLCHVVSRTFEDVTNHYILFKFYEKKIHYRRLFDDWVNL